ncbi:MAG: hypothetical protein F4X16_03060 [Caldilineaceae bacterium SB0661_bin_34]|nr:hypothetical protein [Caldilineaceae bacterium SB0661_bin_34]
MSLYVLGVSLRATAASLEVLGCFVSPASLWRDVQRWQAEAPWDTTEKLLGVVLVGETWLPLEGRRQPVAVVLDTDGRPCDLRRTGSGFNWTAYFRELEVRGVHTLVTDDDPAFRKALQGCGLDRQLCVVHMRRTVRRRLQHLRTGLRTRADATVLRGMVQRVCQLPLWGGQLLLVCCEWAHQGVIQPSPPVLALVEYVMERWNDLIRYVRDPSIPSSTNLLEGWFGRFKPQARLARGLKTPQGHRPSCTCWPATWREAGRPTRTVQKELFRST